MQRLKLMLPLLMSCLVTSMQAQTSPTKAESGFNKVHHFWSGRWIYEGEYKAGPLGPGGKVTGVLTSEMILGGHFVEFRWTEKGATGETHGLEIDTYDPASRIFATSEYHDDGSVASGEYTFEGNTCKYAGTFAVDGKQYKAKNTIIFAADLKSYTSKGELSTDGNTWTTWWEQKYKRATPVPAK